MNGLGAVQQYLCALQSCFAVTRGFAVIAATFKDVAADSRTAPKRRRSL
jgi:hypothetical protein